MDDLAYKSYVADALKAIVGANDRYIDWINRKPADNRSGAEIVAGVVKSAGLVIKNRPAAG